MFKNIISFLLFIIFSVSLTSCKKDTIQNDKKATAITNVIKEYVLKFQAPKDGDIVLEYNDAAWVKNEPADIIIGGAFYKDKNPNNRILRNGFSINNNYVPFNGDNKYPGYFIQSLGNTPEKANWLKSLWETKIKIDLGNSFAYKPVDSADGFLCT